MKIDDVIFRRAKKLEGPLKTTGLSEKEIKNGSNVFERALTELNDDSYVKPEYEFAREKEMSKLENKGTWSSIISSIFTLSISMLAALVIAITCFFFSSLYVGLENVLAQQQRALLNMGNFIVTVAAVNLFVGIFTFMLSFLGKSEYKSLRAYKVVSTFSLTFLFAGSLLFLTSIWIMLVYFP